MGLFDTVADNYLPLGHLKGETLVPFFWTEWFLSYFKPAFRTKWLVMQQKGSLYLYSLLPARTCSNGHHTTYLLTFREVSKLFIKCMGEGKLPNVIFIWESLNSSNEQRKCKQRGSELMLLSWWFWGSARSLLKFSYSVERLIQQWITTQTLKVNFNQVLKLHVWVEQVCCSLYFLPHRKQELLVYWVIFAWWIFIPLTKKSHGNTN